MNSFQDGSGMPWQAHTGNWFAVFGSPGGSAITQVVAGDFNSYSLNLWAGGAGFQVLWDGQPATSPNFATADGFGGGRLGA